MNMLREIMGVWFLLGGWLVLGTLASPQRWARPFDPGNLATSLTLGFLLMAGGASAASGSILTLPAVLIVAAALWEWRLFSRNRAGLSARPDCGLRETLATTSLLAVASVIGWLIVRSTAWPLLDGGRVGLPHADYGFWAMLSKQLLVTKAENYWLASLGDSALHTGSENESWYHWSPLWIAGLAGKAAGVDALRALLGIAAPALFVMAWAVAAAVAGTVTPVRKSAAWLAGLAAMLAIAYPTYGMAAERWLPQLSADQTHEHARYAVALNLVYWPDLALLFNALRAGWHGRRVEACGCILFVAMGSPQACAFLLMGAVFFAVLGWIHHSTSRLRNMALIVGGLAALAWVMARVFYGGLAGQGAMIRTGGSEWVTATRLFGIDLAVAALLNASILWVAGMLAWKERGHPVGQAAQACLGALVLAYAGYRWLLPNGDNSHFLVYGTAVIAWPLGWLLLLRTALSESGRGLRMAAAVCAMATAGCGIADAASFAFKLASKMSAVDQKEVRKMKSRLAGRPVGYFAGAGGDRVWWISHHASLGALLDCRMVRLNLVPVADNYRALEMQQGPPALLGARFAELKSDPAELGLALARALGISVFAQTNTDRLPAAWKPRLKKIGAAGEMTFHELIEPPVRAETSEGGVDKDK